LAQSAGFIPRWYTLPKTVADGTNGRTDTKIAFPANAFGNESSCCVTVGGRVHKVARGPRGVSSGDCQLVLVHVDGARYQLRVRHPISVVDVVPGSAHLSLLLLLMLSRMILQAGHLYNKFL